MRINTYDIDGVINLGDYAGLVPRERDIIITGRSKEERSYTAEWLWARGIYNNVYYNQIPFDEKTREKSGYHKAETLNFLEDQGYEIGVHFEDDPIQADIIEQNTNVKVVRIIHDLVEKENVWHGPKHSASTGTD